MEEDDAEFEKAQGRWVNKVKGCSELCSELAKWEL